ncbi:MAG: methyltransferase domain-containing protein [Pseudomonadota bacterium]|nr:methyltransferase domain-containing protein [Pseudomonadota bacterium]
MQSDRTTAELVAENYYDSRDADRFYELIWGGDDIHIGLYGDDENGDIGTASRKTVATMADRLEGLAPDSRILDLGAGYGGAARYLAERFDCRVTCVNLSEVQNVRNRRRNRDEELARRIRVVHGSFENIPARPESVDVVWSQDAFLHSAQKRRVVSEIARVLKPGGIALFTDPMQADDCEPAMLERVYERLSLDSLASPSWYSREFARLGFEQLAWIDYSPELRRHYAAVRAELRHRYTELRSEISTGYLDRMLAGLSNWVTAADAGYLRWGVLQFRKPAV